MMVWIAGVASGCAVVLFGILAAMIERRARKLDRAMEMLKWQAIVLTLLCREVKIDPPQLPEWVLDL